MKNLLIIVSSILLLSSCREQIDLDMPNSNKHALVVEGYVTEGEKESTVKLSLSTSYTNDGKNPVPANVSYVLIRRTDTANVLSIDTLKEKVINSGEYFLTSSYTPSFGDKYQLEIKWNNEVFKADSKINKKAVIDSIRYHFQPQKAFAPKGYLIDFYARDIKGLGDNYLFEKYKNGSIYYEDINDKITIWDDLLTDGLTFPEPVSIGINPPQANTEKKGYNKDADFPYTINDTITIRILSLDDKTYGFYNDVLRQSSTASGGALGPLFAPPSDNVRSNVYNIDKNGTQVVGVFSARGSVSIGIRIK